MATILVTGANAKDWLQNDEPLAKRLELLGHFVTDNVKLKHDVVICFNLSFRFWKQHGQLIRTKTPKILVVTEPSIVSPENLNARKRSYFEKVIEVGRPAGNLSVAYPQIWDMSYFEENARLDRVVAISGNKWSFIKGELYSLRLACYRNFSEIDLFGTGWEKVLMSQPMGRLKELLNALQGGIGLSLDRISLLLLSPKNWLGPSRNKLETLSHYKVSLVIENSEEYVSEKLLDSLMAGTIPIYVGGNFSDFGIPEDLVLRAEPNLASIKERIFKALHLDYAGWKRSARNWLKEAAPRLSSRSHLLGDLIINEALFLLKD